MTELPWTPDFAVWPIKYDAIELNHTTELLRVTWSDHTITEHHVLLLRENSPDSSTIHPKAREMCIAPTNIDVDLRIRNVSIGDHGVVIVEFSDRTISSYHPGWLRGTAWLGDEEKANLVLWSGDDLPEPPTFNGPEAMESPSVFLKWLEAVRDYGVARLDDLPQQDGLLEEIVTKIGPVRESNFGRQYNLKIKNDPDSQAYTSDMLLQHIDLPTRETPCGLQFLYTRENTTTGGEGIYVDAYRIAEDMRHEDPKHFESLTNDVWEYNNRAKHSDYRASGPVIETDCRDNIIGIRYNTFLRAPLKAPADIQARAYKAYRAFCSRAQDERYMMIVRYQPGDIFTFDNRRVLHGRRGYRSNMGIRFIEGMYADRDDLYSTIRALKRQILLEVA